MKREATRRRKPTTRRDDAAELDNADEGNELAGDLYADLRAADKTGAVDFYRGEGDDASDDDSEPDDENGSDGDGDAA